MFTIFQNSNLSPLLTYSTNSFIPIMTTCFNFKNALLRNQVPTIKESEHWPALSQNIKRTPSNTSVINTDKLPKPNVQIDNKESDISKNVSDDQGEQSEYLSSSQNSNHLNNLAVDSNSRISEDVDTSGEFPELSGGLRVCKERNRTIRKEKEVPTQQKETKKNPSNKEIKSRNFASNRSHPRFTPGPVNVSVFDLIKIRQQKKYKEKCIKKIPVKILCGNKLDGDRPIRRKGKVRPNKHRRLTAVKQEVVLTRRLKAERNVAYNSDIVKAKQLLSKVRKNQDCWNVEGLKKAVDILQLDQVKATIGEIGSTETQAKSQSSRDIAKTILHSKKFPAYCNNLVSGELLKSVESMIVTLRGYQDRQYAKDPMKGFAKRRYVCGFHEAKKLLKLDSAKLVIIATNLEFVPGLPSGRIMEEVQKLCQQKEVPLVYAATGNQIGFWTLKRRRISAFTVLNYESAEDKFKELIQNWEIAKNKYEILLEEIESKLSEKEQGEESVEEVIRNNILSSLSDHSLL